MKKRLFFYCLCTCLMFGMTACVAKKDEAPKKIPSTVKADIMEITPKTAASEAVFTGRVQAKRQILLASKISGSIKNMTVTAGDAVSSGNLLVQMDDAEVMSKLNALNAEKDALKRQKMAMEADLVYVKANFKRIERLKNETAATEDEFERAQSALNSAEERLNAMTAGIRAVDARIKEVDNLLQYTGIVSPVNGWVVEKFMDTGSYVNAGMPILKIDSSDDGFWFEADVDQAFLHQLARGQKVWVSIPSPGSDAPVMTTISEIVPRVSSATNTFIVKADIRLKGLRSGMFGRIAIPTGTRQVIAVPQKALIHRGGITGVYTIGRDRIAHWRVVKLGSEWSEVKASQAPVKDGQTAPETTEEAWVEVLGGLDAKETIAISNLEQVREGIRLE
ncbi:MAG: efflux RND transporter periplasmic adaptor subunit [Deltaproteobacteria bacterium]|jgi:RND family efflux transporter MFP subunit|nr:efflux RND transporter periplasmic adaptor subunit [Deltaproteobacteria bacterium]